jgi:hypothetical protein
MIIGEARRLRVELIEVWRLEKRMTMAAEIAVALIVRHHENNIGFCVLRKNERRE